MCATMLLLLLVVCPVLPISALDPKRPETLTFYVQEVEGSGDNSTLRVLTNAFPSGFFAVLYNNITEGPLTTSKQIGTELGSVTSFGLTGKTIYGAFDMQIQSDEYNGTFLVQGAFDLTVPSRTLVVLGGTGDFYLARGSATFTTSPVQSPGVSVVYKYVVQFEY